MKIGRNTACNCGSGRKYKKCCMNKPEEQKIAEAILKSNKTLSRDARIKQCLHPRKDECSEKIIKAHAIQNNRILNKLSQNGCVVTMDGLSNLIFQGAQKKGRKIATTFTGFCSYHDKILFQEIEDREFNKSQKQIFLWAYRTLSWHYHKKQEQINANNIFFDNMINQGYEPSLNKEHQELHKGFKMAENDNNQEKELFDLYLLNSKYDEISYCIWEIPYEVSFAVSMMHGLEYDIKGMRINNYTSKDYIKNIYLNIFPGESKSYCIWSWLKTNDKAYDVFSKQFMKLDIKDKENYLNNNLPLWSDSVIISPRLWNRWGEGIQQALMAHANFDFLYSMMREEDDEFAYEYMHTPWNLFDNISE
ncbi:hypothetical protein B2H97_10490 [Paraclostridium bifermentans]|uniref:SEC-C metal-binding domain-containing protein n=1 Tax=Paraclostridium bifermentans TaxID=1490 RepID=UPI000A174C9D|nr:SEC-C metal-binding domain-containing protein [Paraclostridium bifermentans]OSB09716.1 hypothetical protein B2H97_10490 [Paraclostridium bifermentans]